MYILFWFEIHEARDDIKALRLRATRELFQALRTYNRIVSHFPDFFSHTHRHSNSF